MENEKITTEEESAKESEVWEAFVTRNYNEGIATVTPMNDEEIIQLLNDLDNHELELERERQATRIKKQAIRAFVTDRKKHLSRAINKSSDKLFSTTLGMKKATEKKAAEKKTMSKEERQSAALAEFGIDLAEFRAELASVKTTKRVDDDDNDVAKLAESK